jgi:hypothetical protein
MKEPSLNRVVNLLFHDGQKDMGWIMGISQYFDFWRGIECRSLRIVFVRTDDGHADSMAFLKDVRRGHKIEAELGRITI